MKRACVIVAATEPARVAEALRAAVGLCLRGGGVKVLCGPAARAVIEAGARADVTRAVATLRELGHDVGAATPATVARAVSAADVIEHWTDGGADDAFDDAEGLRHVVAPESPRRAVIARGPASATAPTDGFAAIVADRRSGTFTARGRAVDSDEVIALLFAADAAIVW